MTSTPDATAVGRLRHAVRRQLPSHFDDPLGLALRLVRTRNRDAYGAAGQALLGFALTPVDLLLAGAERHMEASAADPAHPVLLVCGPPRSGTTLTAQILLAGLDLTRFTNLAMMFPRSPIAASRLARRLVRPAPATFSSYYGRTHGLGGVNDGLPLWDRWLGSDRDRPRDSIDQADASAMCKFFGALETFGGRPVLAKNNSLDVRAGPVLGALPTAHMICLTRDPVALAHSLLRARHDIHGSPSRPYGATHPGPPASDPEEDVCRQVLFHEAAIARQQASFGKRFQVWSYEDVCADPRGLVAEVAEEVLREDVDRVRLATVPGSFPTSRGPGRPDVDARLRCHLDRLRSESEDALPAPPPCPTGGAG